MPSRVVKFGTFQAHLDSGELFRDGLKLKLGGQSFQVLELLLARSGEVVNREELRMSLWPSDTFVDFDHGLNTAINKIREALGDSASNPRFIETIPRRGYRFIAPVDRLTPVVEPEPIPDQEPASPSPAPPQKVASRKWVAVAAGAATVAVVAWLVQSRSGSPVPVEYKLTQVTRDSGLTCQPSISADGNFVVYSSDRATGKDMDLWIQHVSGGQPVRLTSTQTNEIQPSISADGRKVAFHIGSRGGEQGIFVVPALGGTPKMVVSTGHQPQISPDGTSVAYSTGWYMQQSEIRVVSTEGGSARTVTTGLKWAMEPLWTRNGRNLLLWGGNDYWMVPASGGVAKNTGADGQLIKTGVHSMIHIEVTADPSPTASEGPAGLVIAARSGDGYDLWLTPLSGGKASPAVRITLGAGAANPSVAAATGRIAFARRSVSPGLWMLPIEGSTGRVTSELRRAGRENVTMGYPSVSSDGKKLAYVSNRGGDPDVWVRNLDTGVDRQLTSSKLDEFRAVISPNGERIAYGHDRRLYVVPSSSGEEKLVCKDCGNVVGWSPDGSKLLYYWGVPKRHAVVDLASGQKRDVVWHPTADIHNGRISPDGRWITFTLVGEGPRVVYIASMADGGGGKPGTWIRISGEEKQTRSSFWSLDGNLLYIHQEGALWARRLRPDTKTPIGDAFVVQQFDGRFTPIFSAHGITRDSLYFLMMETTANIWIADPVGR